MDKDNVHQTIDVTYSGVVPDTFKPGAEVIVEGGMMAAQYSKANSLMREHGATEGFGTVVPVPFIYTAPVSTTPSVTAK